MSTPAPEADNSSLAEVLASDSELLHDLGYKQELRRALGFLSSFCLSFTVVAVAAGLALAFNLGFLQVGPLLLLAWVVGGILQVLVAMSVAVAASAYPLAGGPYQIIRAIGFRRFGWHTGFILILGVIASIAGEAVALVSFYAGWFGVTLTSHWAVLAAATAVLGLCTAVNLAGVKVAAFVNNGAAVAEGIAILILVVGLIIAFFFGNDPFQNLSFLAQTSDMVPAGASSVLPFLYAMLVPFFTIAGFYAVATTGEETRGADHTIPRALWTSALISLIIGVVILFLALLAISDIQGTASAASPLTFILESRIGSVTAKIFEVLAITALTVNLMLLQLAGARMVWAYARDREIPSAERLSRLNKHQIPVLATVGVAAVAVLFCAWSSLLNVLIALAAVLAALPIGGLILVAMRARATGQMRSGPYTLGRWAAPVMAVSLAWTLGLCGVLVYQDPGDVGVGLMVCLVLGLVLYPLVSRREQKPVSGPPEGEETDVRGVGEVGR